MALDVDAMATAGPTGTGSEAAPGQPDRPVSRDEVVAASELVAACEAAWSAIQARHPGVPDAVIVLGSGVERGRLVKLGHWWGGQWRVGAEERSEVLLAGEALHLPAEAVFEVLLHEAAHGLNAARGVRDASRGGRYHNANFRAAATEIGLRARRLDPYGWARTVLTPATAAQYAEPIAGIAAQMRLARDLPAERGTGLEGSGSEGVGVGADGSAGRDRAKQPAAECSCEPGRKLRMAPSVLARGPVICGLCGTEFSLSRQPERRMPGSAAQPGPGTELSRATVDGSFLERRHLQLDRDPARSDLLEQARAHLDRLETAVNAVAISLPDGALMRRVFADGKAGIAAWIETLGADVAELPGRRRGPSAGSIEMEELDLRNVELPELDLEAERPSGATPTTAAEQPPPAVPNRSGPEVVC
ncbi:MAG: hypothetical protein ACRD0Q_07215 [Acidimicrobiales bacterium]